MIHIYTDGACSGNPGPGGWAAVIYRGKQVDDISGNEPETTNNRMELLAAIKALQHVKEINITVWADSLYVVNGASKWLSGWVKREWLKGDLTPVANKDLWVQLIPLLEGRKVLFKHVKGHSGVEGNELADKLASESCLEAEIELLSG